MLKKMLPTDSTFTRAIELTALGTLIVATPVLGASPASVNGKVLPPSIESNMRTLLQSIGELEVPATFHVTVCVEPASHWLEAMGWVTLNGPNPDRTFT
jgi:hypothetical protein